MLCLVSTTEEQRRYEQKDHDLVYNMMKLEVIALDELRQIEADLNRKM